MCANLELEFKVVPGIAMSTTYTIGQLGRAAGVPTSSVRYYERRGLVVPDERSGGNYRRYGDTALERLRFIKSAQAAGFTLKDIELLLDFRDGDVAPCREVQELIGVRLAKVNDEIEHLHHVRDVLGRWMRICRRAAKTGRCGVLDGLSSPCDTEGNGPPTTNRRKTTNPT